MAAQTIYLWFGREIGRVRERETEAEETQAKFSLGGDTHAAIIHDTAP